MRKGSTSKWRRLRAYVLERDRHRCHWCGAYATHCDHVVPVVEGGRDEPSNLVAACATCNLERGRKLTERRNRHRRYGRPEFRRREWPGAITTETR